jgi:CheY-like chemotaxis protein
VVRDAIDATGAIIESAGQELVVDIPETPLVLDGDETRLTQILVNLLNNAAKYTGPGGRIELRATREGDTRSFASATMARASRSSAMPHIFEMFNRGDRDSNRNQAGLGIGLALSRQLANLHGGTLEASSAGHGHGQRFHLRVPLSASQEPEAPAPTSRDVDLRVQRVLVVDDNIDAGDTLAALLRVLGAEVHVARDGMEALVRIRDVLAERGDPRHRHARDEWLRGRAGDPQSHPGTAITLVALTGWAQDADRRARHRGRVQPPHGQAPNLEALQRVLAVS